MAISAAIYVRISSDPDATRRGVERQEDECRDLADRLGWTVARVYVDNDVSAASGKPRPEFERMLADVAAGAVDGIVVWHTDRLYRRAVDLVRIVDALQSTPIRTVTSGDLDLSTSSGRMQARILGAVAEGEVEHSVERMKLAHRQAAESGKWRVRRRVFGYKLGGQEIEPIEAQAIRLAATDILGGVSTSEIARRWNREGLRTSGRQLLSPTGAKLENGHGSEWTSRRVGEQLRNALYAQRVTYNGQILTGVVGQWPRILDDDVFDAVAAFLDGRRQPTRKDRLWQGSSVYRCGACHPDEGGMLPKMEVARRGGIPHYRCRVKGHNRRDQRRLDDYVDSIVLGRLARPDALDLLDKGTGVDLPALTARRDGLLARIDSATGAWSTDDGLDYSDLLDAVKPLRDQVAEIDRQLAAQAQRDPVAELLLAEGDLDTVWSGLSPERRSKIIDVLMSVVILPVVKRGNVFDADRIVIEWKR
ncbi:recombinase family protein [Rhodococcus sp. P1Y]|uniref:recombinase family protein n=1 Tax=Rhodococcus sp. P1Y TaxID=1302308 RepID=UPI000EAE95B6|nr:recombinase family protein [Rhodococcus sp. P1Y]AYJ47503.1 recombinase family protein [Rhodococcus sp. P1Y]